jgi:hypothetical protein
MKITFALLLGVLSLNARAAQPDQFDLAAWQKLTLKVAASTLTSVDGYEREYHSLKRFTLPDPMDSRVADYISVVGNTQSDGTFHVDHLEIVVEKWQIELDNVKSADQWAYSVKTDGTVTFVMHQTFSEEYDGTVLSNERLKAPALTDPAMLKQLGAKIAEWEAAQ